MVRVNTSECEHGEICYQRVNGGDGINGNSEQSSVVVDPLHVGQLNIWMQHGVMRWWFLNGHRQAEFTNKQAAVTQQWQPCVTNDCLQL